jgi:receptor protein-tyrosine kinase
MNLIEKAAQRMAEPAPRSLLERAEARGLFAAPRPVAQPAADAPGPAGPSTTAATAAAATAATAATTPAAGRPHPLDRAALARAGYALAEDRRSRTAEEMRVIMRRLAETGEAASSPALPSSLMVTSARPGEGKTFFAMNLALAMARDGSRPVVLVDADLRRQGLSSAFGLAGAPGLADLLSGEATADQALASIEGLPLAVLPAGRTKPGDLPLSEPRIRRIAEEVAARLPGFVAVFDTPPLLAATEGILLAPYVERVLMLVEADRTPERAIGAALDLLSSTEHVSMVLNKAPSYGGEEAFGSYYGAADATGEPVRP